MGKNDSGGGLAGLPVPNYPADAFVGTAQYYARYRVPYPQMLIEDLLMRAGGTGAERLLDLACGPGRVTLPLARFFREVWAVDLEPEMVEVGRAEAARQGVTNVRWLVGRAEEVEASANSFELITIGDAFHRLDRWLIAKRALEWLAPGRCLATLGCDGVFEGDERWQALVAAILGQWGVTSPGSGQPVVSGPGHPNEGILRAAGFDDVASYEFLIPYTWTLDAIVGNLYSTSVASKRALGDRAADFEADLRRTLLDYDASGEYPVTLSFGYTLARQPQGHRAPALYRP
jgi:SAM-dependent methyltransferase